jgi:hypothetical protein
MIRDKQSNADAAKQRNSTRIKKSKGKRKQSAMSIKEDGGIRSTHNDSSNNNSCNKTDTSMSSTSMAFAQREQGQIQIPEGDSNTQPTPLQHLPQADGSIESSWCATRSSPVGCYESDQAPQQDSHSRSLLSTNQQQRHRISSIYAAVYGSAPAPQNSETSDSSNIDLNNNSINRNASTFHSSYYDTNEDGETPYPTMPLALPGTMIMNSKKSAYYYSDPQDPYVGQNTNTTHDITTESKQDVGIDNNNNNNNNNNSDRDNTLKLPAISSGKPIDWNAGTLC